MFHLLVARPLRDKGKGLAVNTIMAEVQQVTPRSKAKTTEWAKQDEIRTAAKVWVKKANVSYMRQERANAASSCHMTDTVPEVDAIWQITLTMDKLLNLAP